MKHPEKGIITEFLNGQLTAEEAASVEQHLGKCAECSALKTRLSLLYSDIPRIAPPPSSRFTRSVMERINASGNSEKAPRFSLGEIVRSWAAPAFSCALSIFLLMQGDSSLASIENSDPTAEALLLPIAGNIDGLFADDSESGDIL